MGARPLFTLALLFTGLASLAWGQGPPASTTAVPASAKPFKHGQHVAKAWLEMPEVWRDCRGCHRFDNNNLVSAPQQHCSECHGPAPGFAPAPGWPKDLEKFRSRTRDAFRHYTHAMLECRQCHGPVGQDFLPDDFDIRTGPGQCAACHEQGQLAFMTLRFFDSAAKEAAEALGTEAYQKKLVEAFAGPDGGINKHPLPVGGDFDHADHCGVIKTGESLVLGSLLQCVDCHTNIKQASARETGTGKIPINKCGSCHKTEKAPAGAATAAKKPPRLLRSLGTFAHVDHYTFLARGTKMAPPACREEAYTGIEKGCDACHKGDSRAFGRPDADFPFDGEYSKYRYLDCTECHNVPGWQTGETPAAPLHASTRQLASGSEWARCEKCHVFGKPDMAKVRVMTEVERLAGRTFVFPANVHPNITKSGITRSEDSGRAVVQDCKECHRARVPALDTRLQKKVFRHDTHLPTVPQPGDCKECHPRASTAEGSAKLADSDQRTYTLQDCTKCHWGDRVVEEQAVGETEQMTPQKKTRVEFPHGKHVGENGNLSCLECHATAADRRNIGTLPGALLCNKCHDHKKGQPGEPTYEGLFNGGASSCARCHHEASADNASLVAVVPLIGASAADTRYDVERTRFAGFVDAQFHPLVVQCAECHKANESNGRLVEVVTHVKDEDRLSATKKESVHAKGRSRDQAQCLQCHWKRVGSWEAAVNTSVPPGDDRNLRLQPGSEATRLKFGNDREGYPGNRARG